MKKSLKACLFTLIFLTVAYFLSFLLPTTAMCGEVPIFVRILLGIVFLSILGLILSLGFILMELYDAFLK